MGHSISIPIDTMFPTLRHRRNQKTIATDSDQNWWSLQFFSFYAFLGRNFFYFDDHWFASHTKPRQWGKRRKMFISIISKFALFNIGAIFTFPLIRCIFANIALDSINIFWFMLIIWHNIKRLTMPSYTFDVTTGIIWHDTCMLCMCEAICWLNGNPFGFLSKVCQGGR